MMKIPRFHLAFPVNDLELAREFYTNILGCNLGRESKKWIDFNMHGHQVVAHLSPKDCKAAQTNSVDGNQVPARHFGIILPWEDWETLGEKIRKSDIEFMIEPKKRFKKKKGEQGTFFIQDPSGNALEFKSFKDDKMVFEK